MNTHAHTQQVHWGRIIAGAAIAAGAIAAFVIEPSLGASVIDGLKDMAGATYQALGDAASWAWSNVVGSADVEAIKAATAANTEAATMEGARHSIEAFVKTAPELAGDEGAMLAERVGAVAESAKENAGALGKAANETTKGLFGFAVKNQALAIGAAAVAGGVVMAKRGKEEHHKAHEHHARHAEEDSFSMREDMRRMQALMAARMAAQGYAPAMAQQGIQR